MESGTEKMEEKKSHRKLEQNVLDDFSKLVNPHANVRMKSATGLLKHLIQNDETTTNKSDEIKYAIKRLIRGLGSSTLSARTGFYTTLVVLMEVNEHITVKDIFDPLNTELHRSAKNTDGENADICIGQILACGAIIRSNLWYRSTDEDQQKVLELLLIASKERSYLNLFGYMFINSLIEVLNEEDVRNKIFSIIETEISRPWLDHNLDSLYLLLYLKNRCPNLVCNTFLSKTLGTNNIVCIESIKPLARVLMTVPGIASLKHPVYDLIPKEISQEYLPQFFEELNEHLKLPNRNRLLIFNKLLTNVILFLTVSQNGAGLSVVPDLLTKNYIQQTLSYFKTFKGKHKDMEFQGLVRKTFETILTALQHEGVKSNVKISVLKKFLFHPGTLIFEKITGSKIIQQITASLNSKGVKKLAELYKRVVVGSEEIDSGRWLNNDRLYSAHLLIKLLNHHNVRIEIEWKTEQLNFLMKLVLLKEENSIGRELSESLKLAFYGALDLKLSKLEDLQTILSQLIHDLNSLINAENLEMVLRNPLPPEGYEIFQNTMSIISKIEKKKKKSGLKSVFLTLFLHMGLQLFNDFKLAADSLNELFVCYDKVRKDGKSKQSFEESISHTANDTNENDPVWVEVVVDLFLNLLSHNSHLLRSIINCVFPHLCQYMTATTIHQIVSVLDPKNDENPLSKDGDSSENDVDSDDDETDNKEHEELSEEESDDEEDIVEDESVNDKLRMALHQALSKNGDSSGEESLDLDNMSDTEMEKLDDALADAFRQFKPNLGKRKKQTKDQETLTHFRVRVLDLIDMYLDSTPSMILALEIMLPLLQAVEFSIRDQHQKPLNDRLKSCLKKLAALKTFGDVEGVDQAVLTNLLKSLLEKGTKNMIIVQEMGEQICDCCLFVIKCSDTLRIIESTPKKSKKELKHAISQLIVQELTNFFTRRDCLTPYVLFKKLLQISWDGSITLVKELLTFVFSNDLKQYKKTQATELLKIFYANRRYLSQKSEKVNKKLSQQHENFSENIIRYFKELCQDTDKKGVKERFICNLFMLVSMMKQSPLNIEVIDWPELAEKVREYRTYKTFSKDAKIAYNKLCKSIGVSNIVKMKNNTTKLTNVNEENDDSSIGSKEKTKAKKKNKKINKDKQKLKKAAKVLRLESLSEGLSRSLDFSYDKDIKIDQENLIEGEFLVNGTSSTEIDKDLSRKEGSKEEIKNIKRKKKQQVNNGELKSNTNLIKDVDEEIVPKKRKKKHLIHFI